MDDKLLSKKDKLKKVIYIMTSIILVIILLLNSTYSLLVRTDETEKQSYTTGILEITSETTNNSVTLTNSLPMEDSKVDSLTPYTFKITNTGNLNYTFDVKLLSTTTNNQIESQYIKIKVNDNNITSLNTLTDGKILENITLAPKASIDINLKVWLDINTPNSQIGKVFNAKIVTEGYAEYTVPAPSYPKIDNSNANAPAYAENLVPVMHNGTTWVTADTTSSTSEYGWYDYDVKKWANAVLLTEAKRNSLEKSGGYYTPGQTIGDTESAGVLAFYVWIPRYKYKVWNINKVIATDTYSAQTKGIDIVFEEGTSTTGGITCEYSHESLEEIGGSPSPRPVSFILPLANEGELNETCTNSGDGYYTHPAFTFGNDELTGIWMGKFELSSSNPSASDGGSTSVILTPRILPNVTSWRNNYVESYWKVIKDMQVSNNIYGLSTDLTKVDTHMLTNMEWGAVVYLTHSKYGRCTGGTNSTCTEVSINNSSNRYTGKSSGAPGSSSTSTSPMGTYSYNETNGQLASTTGNIYGVYDMSGGAWEYVMGNVSSSRESYIYNASKAADSGTYYTYSGNEKYLTTYANGGSYGNQTAYNRGRLGDATSEVVITSESSSGASEGWYNDSADFSFGAYPWFHRGGSYSNGSYTGVFYFLYGNGDVGYYDSTRAALSVISS